MKTVKEISKITGISIRTLRYYDEIGLLKPAKVSEAGYRLYDEVDLEKLQEILFYKELELSLSEIKKIIEHPKQERRQALEIQKSLLEQKRNRLNGIIELLDDVMKGVNTMSFGAFSEKEANDIIEHSLQLQNEECIEIIKKEFGSLEKYKQVVSENLREEETEAELIKIYGSKDKAVKASLSATGNREELVQIQKEIDNIYHQFAYAKETENFEMAIKEVKKLAESYKKLLKVDNARYILLKMSEDYISNGILVEATDKQYGEGVTRYIGEAIKQYYGML